MNSIKFEKICESYFEIDKPNTIKEAVVLALKCLSYLTGLAPLGFAICWGISKLLNRVKIVKELSKLDEKTQKKWDEIKRERPIVGAPRQELDLVIAKKSEKSGNRLGYLDFGGKAPIRGHAKSVEATKDNLESLFLNFLPRDIQLVILSFLDNTHDVKALTLVSTGMPRLVETLLSAKALNAKSGILKLIEFAQFFDEQIRIATQGKRSLIKDEKLDNAPIRNYRFFQFDCQKWENVINRLHLPKIAFQADKLIEECLFDLVEALAEYNIDNILFEQEFESIDDLFSSLRIDSSYDKEKKRFLYQIKVPDEKFELNKILNHAKNTLKGDMFITSFSAYDSNLWMTSPENGNWGDHYYYRTRDYRGCNNIIPLETLIGKKEGDRIIIPHPQNGEFRILRCVQSQYRYHDDFEQTLTREILYYSPARCKWIVEPEKIARYNEVYEMLKEAYGEKFVKEINDSLPKK